MIEGKPFEYFSIWEIKNNDATDKVKLVFTPELIAHGNNMDKLRKWAVETFPNQFPQGLRVSSWYRTELYNRAVGGAKNSLHLIGGATDISNIPDELYQEFIKAWRAITIADNKVGGIELYKWGMHFDSFSDRFGYRRMRVKDNR